MTIILATRNLHKIREIREILSVVRNLDLITLLNCPGYQEPEDLPRSIEERAAKKALHAAQTLNKWAIADETHLLVPAIKEDLSILTDKRERSDKELRKALLEKMQGLEGEKRHAYFHCTLSLASPEGLIKTVSAKTEGMILREEKGSSGFGFDSLFIKHEYDKTFAEMDETTKNRISHRRKALDRLIPLLEGRMQSIKATTCPF